MAILDDLKQATMDGEEELVIELTQKAIDEGIDPMEIINDGLIAGMGVVGARFKAGEMFVPQVLMTANAMKGGVELATALLGGESATDKPTVVLGTVEGDLHDIGKNLVVIMFEAQGYDVIDVGMDVSVDTFINAAKENDAKLIGMSALLTTTMPVMPALIEKLKEEGIRDDYKVIIGGAPVTQEYADEIGADGYSADAQSAVELSESLGV